MSGNEVCKGNIWEQVVKVNTEGYGTGKAHKSQQELFSSVKWSLPTMPSITGFHSLLFYKMEDMSLNQTTGDNTMSWWKVLICF